MITRKECFALEKEARIEFVRSVPLPLRYYYQNSNAVSEAIKIIGEDKYLELIKSNLVVCDWMSRKEADSRQAYFREMEAELTKM